MKRKRKFQYVRRPPFIILFRLAEWEMHELDAFLELADTGKAQKRQELEQLAAGASSDSDWLVDDFGMLDEMPSLASQFAIVGLWRCIELFRKHCLVELKVPNAKEKAYNAAFVLQSLRTVGLKESRLRCARSINELRCLNNSVKHAGVVQSELAKFRGWRDGDELGDVTRHYRRLRPLCERYLKDMAARLTPIWKKQQKTMDVT